MLSSQLVKEPQSQLRRRERMLGATLVCAVGSSRYRAHENGQRPFSVVFLNDFRVALRILITRPQATEVSKMLNFRHFPSDWQ